MRKLYAYIVLAVTLVALSLFSLPGIVDGMKTGIEFKGGFEITYQVLDSEGSEYASVEDKQSARDSALEVVANRLDISGVKSVGITASGDDGIVITVASNSESETLELRQLLTSNAEITFRDSSDTLLATADEVLKENGAKLDYQDGSPVVGLSISNTDVWYNITNYIATSTQDQLMVIWVGYEEGVDSYSNPESQGKIISAATVGQAFYGDVIITGSFDAASAQQMANLIKAGSIDFHLKELSVNTIGAEYGESAFENSLLAGAIGISLVAVLMIVLYGIAGVTSVVSLIVFVIATLLVFNMMNGEYGPDTIAATVISIGMAVDSCVISYERMKEELWKGKSLKKSFVEGNTKSLSTILDGNITTLIAAFALYLFGTRTVKGFAIMLIISTFITMIIMVGFNKFLLGLVCNSSVFENKKSWFGVRMKHVPDIKKGEQQHYFGKFNNLNFRKFFKPFERIFLGIMGLGVIAGIVYQLVFGGFTSFEALNLGINFSEGTKTYFQTIDPTFDSEEKVEDFFRNEVAPNFPDIVIDEIIPDQIIVGEGKGITMNDSDRYYYQETLEKFNVTDAQFVGNTLKVYTVSITYKNALDEGVQEYLDNYLTDMMNELWDYEEEEGIVDMSYNGINFVSPVVGTKTVTNALYSLFFASIFIILYVALRFKLSYSISAIYALVHDSLTMLMVFSLFRIEIDVVFVSAVLAIIGYSVNDTIVIFDRIRELQREDSNPRVDYDSRLNYCNRALQESFTRSIWTSTSTMITVVALLIFGGESSINFNIAMLVGLTIGAFSSLTVAPSLWVKLDTKFAAIADKWKKKRAAKPKVQTGEVEEYTFFGIND